MQILNTQNTIMKILQENPPLFSTQIYEEYTERAGPLAISKVGVRKNIESLYKMGHIHRGKEYIKGKGYLYTIASKPTPVAGASHDSVTFGEVSSSALELIQFLYTNNTHPLLSQANWDGFRFNLILTLLGAGKPEFKDQVTAMRDSLLRTLGQLNTIIDGDVWSAQKQEVIKKSIPNHDAITLIIRQYLNNEIDTLPDW